jgi:hypothetical protein
VTCATLAVTVTPTRRGTLVRVDDPITRTLSRFAAGASPNELAADLAALHGEIEQAERARDEAIADLERLRAAESAIRSVMSFLQVAQREPAVIVPTDNMDLIPPAVKSDHGTSRATTRDLLLRVFRQHPEHPAWRPPELRDQLASDGEPRELNSIRVTLRRMVDKGQLNKDGDVYRLRPDARATSMGGDGGSTPRVVEPVSKTGLAQEGQGTADVPDPAAPSGS